MDKITLRPFKPKNIELTFKWVQDKELQHLFTIRGEPNWETHTAYFKNILSDKTQILFAIYNGDYHIGNCGLKNIEGYECELWIYIGDINDRGKGFGLIACQKLVEIALNKLEFRRIYLHVLSDNLPAINMYNKLGFKKTAFNDASKAVWEGRGLDMIKMEKISTSMKKYMVIGGGTLQCDFITTVKRMGYEAHVFDYNPHCPGAEIADFFHCISIDKIDDILEKAQEINPVGIQTVATELGNITACYVGEKLGLRTNTYETALNTSDKSRMKKVFASNNIPAATYTEVTDISEVDVENLLYPVVVKPSDRSAGRGVTLVRNAEFFKPSFELAKNEANNKIVLIEEFMLGKQFSVETISAEGSHYIVMFTEEYFDGSDNLIESQHLNPARLTESEKNELTTLIIKTLNIFNISYGASHIEVRLTKGGFKIIEVASRMGGWRDKLVKLSTGCDYNVLLINATTGQKIQIKRTNDHWSIVNLILDNQDYKNYLKIKKDNPELIVSDYVREMNTKKAKCIMDSKGFYYILLDKSQDPDKYLRG